MTEKRSALDLVGGYDSFQSEVNRIFRNSYSTMPTAIKKVEGRLKKYTFAEMPEVDLGAMVRGEDQIWTSQGIELMFGCKGVSRKLGIDSFFSKTREEVLKTMTAEEKAYWFNTGNGYEIGKPKITDDGRVAEIVLMEAIMELDDTSKARMQAAA